MATYLVLWLNTSKLHFYGERMRRSSQLNNHTVESLQIVLGAGYQGEYRVGIGRISFFFIIYIIMQGFIIIEMRNLLNKVLVYDWISGIQLFTRAEYPANLIPGPSLILSLKFFN